MRRISRCLGSQLPPLAVFSLIASSSGVAVAEQSAARAAFDACEATRCLGVEVAPEALGRMGAGEGLGVEAFADALRVRYAGDEPLTVRVIAMRYQDGRLMRYRVSERSEVSADEGAAPLEAAAEALRGAFGPVTESRISVTTLAEGDVGFGRIAMERMIGNLPPTDLHGDEESGGLLDASGDDDLAAATAAGAIGIVALLPEQGELRALEETRSYALLVALNPVRR